MANGIYHTKRNDGGSVSVLKSDPFVRIMQYESIDEQYDVFIYREEAIEAARAILAHLGEELSLRMTCTKD